MCSVLVWVVLQIQKYSSCLCALRALFKSDWGLERNQFLGCVRVQTVQTVSRPSRPLVLAGIQVVSCAARPLTLRVASGYRGGVFFELTRD